MARLASAARALAWIALLAAAVAAAAVAQNNGLHVRLVDAGPQGFLFRGPSPVNETSGEFNRVWLEREMMFRLARHNHGMPSEYNLVVVSLLTDEEHILEAERRYFESAEAAAHGDEFRHWPIYGTNSTHVRAVCEAVGVPSEECPGSQPANFTASALRKMSLAFEPALDSDNLLELVTQLRKDLRPHSHVPNLVYIHSVDGSDRTGEVAAAYAMRYLRQTFTIAMEYDVNVPTPPRNIEYGYQVYLQWFCSYLEHNGLYAHGDDCLMCGPFACDGN